MPPGYGSRQEHFPSPRRGDDAEHKGFAQLESIALLPNAHVLNKLLWHGLTVEAGFLSRVGGAAVFERMNLHDATKQTNDRGPHSPSTSGAETHRASPTDVRSLR